MPCIIEFVPTAAATAVSVAHRVVALALPGVMLLDLAAPTHLFGHCGTPYYSFELAGLHAGPVRSSTGVDVLAAKGLSALRRADTIVVQGSPIRWTSTRSRRPLVRSPGHTPAERA